MKKFLLIMLSFFYVSMLILSAMLVSVMPGLLKGYIFLDNDTIFRFFILFTILIFFTYITIFCIDYKKNILLKINNYIFFLIYIIFIFLILMRRASNNVGNINLIPFKYIVLSSYDFITLAEEVSLADYIKIIILPMIYLLPIHFIILKKQYNNYFKLSIFIIISMEIIKFILYRSFNIDYIILGVLTCIILFEINHSLSLKFGRGRVL